MTHKIKEEIEISNLRYEIIRKCSYKERIYLSNLFKERDYMDRVLKEGFDRIDKKLNKLENNKKCQK